MAPYLGDVKPCTECIVILAVVKNQSRYYSLPVQWYRQQKKKIIRAAVRI
jgi:hypothetical protein